MNKSTLLILALGAFALTKTKEVVANTVNDFTSKLSINFVKTKIRFSSLLSIPPKLLIDLNFEVVNRNNIGLTLNGISGKLSYEGVNIGTVNSTGQYQIANNSTSPFDVTIEVPILSLPDSIKQLIQNRSFSSNLRFKGTMRIGSVNIPVDREIPLIQ